MATQSDVASGVVRRRGLSLKQRHAALAYTLLLPTLLVISLIVIFPMLWNVVLSFQLIRLRDLPTINLFDLSNLSLKNYATATGITLGGAEATSTAAGRRFWEALRVTFIYTIASTVLAILLGLWAALVVRDKFPGRNIFRGFLLFPYVAPVVSLAFIWKLMLDKNIGIVNAMGTRLGLPSLSFLTTRALPVHLFGLEVTLPLALITVIAFEAWHYFPFAFLFLLARMQAIPEEMYEAAKVDGASPLQRLWYITLPHLSAVMGTLFLLRFIWTFNKFEDIFLLNGGAAGTEVLTLQIYNWLFARRNVGVSAAVAVILAVILSILALIYLRWFLPEEE
ncbi:MAG TPA: sugar ABC transporter permease [Chloroflexi bacterium]|nr:sugar ABC transporter permease [Chloroflexota bacterium]